MLQTVRLLDFRGYATLEAEFGPGPHLVWGPNAAGKTSLLEAMVLLAWGHSHRTAADGELIRWGTDLARDRGRRRTGRHRGGDRPLRRPAAPAGRKRIRVNGVGRRARRARGARCGSSSSHPRRCCSSRDRRPSGAPRSTSSRAPALTGLRQRPLDVRPDAPAAQRPPPGDPRGEARRATSSGSGTRPSSTRGGTDRRRPAAASLESLPSRSPPLTPRSRPTRRRRPARARVRDECPARAQ